MNVSKSENSKNENHAYLVASGIFLSRVAGLIRERAFAFYFGNSDAGDAFKAALKIPNFLQNLFGEGVLSASFIPVYASLLAQDKKEEAQKVAGAIATFLALIVSFLVLGGTLATPHLIDLIAPGFHGEKRDLTIHLVQIFFPGTGLLVMSAWCLGILNSHRKFFLSYVAPVIWNFAIIGALVIFGSKSTQNNLAVTAGWGLVLGSALQFLVQLPVALKLLGSLKLGLGLALSSVQTVIKNFFPVLISRGVIQISAYIDNVLASFLPTGAVSALAYTQTIYLLPVSLFGMAVSAAELPAMSRTLGLATTEVNEKLRGRINDGIGQIAFFIVPSVVAFIMLGDVIVAAIFQSGVFSARDTNFVWGILAGATVGLLASTSGRLYSSAFYALRDTKTPLRFALVRVVLTTALGYFCALKLPGLLQVDSSWGTAGLTASAGIAGWVEFLLLKRTLNKRIGETGFANAKLTSLWLAALSAGILGFITKVLCNKLFAGHLGGSLHHVLLAVVVFSIFGIFYLVVTKKLGIKESGKIARKLHLPI